MNTQLRIKYIHREFAGDFRVQAMQTWFMVILLQKDHSIAPYSLLIGLCKWMVTELFGCHGDNKKMLSSFACVDDFELDELIWVLLQNLNVLYVVGAKLLVVFIWTQIKD